MPSDRVESDPKGAGPANGTTSTLSLLATKVLEKPSATVNGPSVVVKNLGKSFGGVQALRDVSFEINRGEVVALLGPNGAGKTTTVNILSTLTAPDRGHASVAGYDVVSEAAGVRHSLMLTGQYAALDDMLTGRENLILFGRLQNMRAADARSRADELIDKFDLAHAADRRVGTYSGGMRRRIDIACGLVIPPQVVFLDEPTTGLDPRSRQTIWDLVTEFKSLGIATLLTTQYLEEADALSDRIIVIDHGVVVAEGTADELKERTGGSYCEIVPRDPKDLQAIAAALGPLLPEENRAALTPTSDRVNVPAPGGASTLLEAMSRLSATNVELADVALRRPSLDDVFLSLTDLPAPQNASAPDHSAADEPKGGPASELGRRILRDAAARRVLSPVLAGLLVGGVIAAIGLTGNADSSEVSTADRPPAARVIGGDIASGACLTWPANTPADASVVDCNDDHLFEVAGSFGMSNGQAPCQLAVQRYLGTRYDPDGRYTVSALWPSNASQSNPDDKLLCGLQSIGPDGQPLPIKGQVAQQDQSRIWPTGTCLAIDSSTAQPANEPVDCAAPHAVEITGTVNLDEEFPGPPPTQEAQDAFLEKACTQTADGYLPGTPLKATGLTVYYRTLSPESWLAGSRQVSCGIGATVGSDRGWATLTGTVTGGHLINGQPPVVPEPERREPTEEYEAPPVTSEYVPDYEDTEPPTTPTTLAPTANPSPSPSTEAIPGSTTTGAIPPEAAPTTSQGPPPGGLVIAVPGFSPITMTPTSPPPPPGPPPPEPLPPLPEGPRPGP